MTELRLHTTAIVECLNDAGLIAEAGEVPVGAGWQGDPVVSAFQIYAVVWPLPGSSFDGSLGNPDEDASFAFQISAWGHTLDAAQRAGDEARDALVGRQIVVPDRSTLRCYHDGGLGVTHDDSLQPRLWHSRERYRLDTTPDLSGS